MIRTMQGARGLDKAKMIRDTLLDAIAKGISVDKIAVSRGTLDDLQVAWLESAPESALFPPHIEGVPFQLMDMTEDFAFLRDYMPWEKRRALADGSSELYREGAQKVITEKST